ncbi:30209_t:CDS:1, partial [Racocetra persica]
GLPYLLIAMIAAVDNNISSLDVGDGITDVAEIDWSCLVGHMM